MRVNQPYDVLKTYEGEELDWKGQLSHNPLLLSPNGELSHFHLSVGSATLFQSPNLTDGNPTSTSNSSFCKRVKLTLKEKYAVRYFPKQNTIFCIYRQDIDIYFITYSVVPVAQILYKSFTQLPYLENTFA